MVVKRNEDMVQQEIVDHYAQTGYEGERLSTETGRLEYARTREIIQRYLSPQPSVILDVGGGPGAYSLWLAGMGHTVHLIDMVPRHIEIARERSRAARTPLASVEIGEARSLPYADGYADIVLLMGPLYHLVEREERLDALRENGRVLKRGGRMLCAAISRYASLLDGFRTHLFDDPEYEKIVDRDLQDGQHRNPEGKDFFTTAYLYRPTDLREEITGAGLVCEKVVGVEGPVCILNELNEWLDRRDRYYELTLKYAQAVEEEPSLLGASFHLLAIVRKP